ncbi:MAG: MerR family transcriptional regulator [bacterium]
MSTVIDDQQPADGIPSDKLYFRIGEVARIVGVKPYVLRYWESEFSGVRPGKSRSNQRLYRRKDVEKLLKIKDLLHTRRYTMEGARQYLKVQEEPGDEELLSPRQLKRLRQVRETLVDLKKKLES